MITTAYAQIQPVYDPTLVSAIPTNTLFVFAIIVPTVVVTYRVIFFLFPNIGKGMDRKIVFFVRLLYATLFTTPLLLLWLSGLVPFVVGPSLVSLSSLVPAIELVVASATLVFIFLGVLAYLVASYLFSGNQTKKWVSFLYALIAFNFPVSWYWVIYLGSPSLNQTIERLISGTTTTPIILLLILFFIFGYFSYRFFTSLYHHDKRKVAIFCIYSTLLTTFSALFLISVLAPLVLVGWHAQGAVLDVLDSVGVIQATH